MVLNLSLSLGPETQSLGLGVGLEVGSLGCPSLDHITDEITALSNINDSVRNLRNCRVYCQDVTTVKNKRLVIEICISFNNVETSRTTEQSLKSSRYRNLTNKHKDHQT